MVDLDDFSIADADDPLLVNARPDTAVTVQGHRTDVTGRHALIRPEMRHPLLFHSKQPIVIGPQPENTPAFIFDDAPDIDPRQRLVGFR